MSAKKSKKKPADLYPEPTTALLAELTPHPRNYREHPDEQLDHIIASIRANGFYRNIVLARGNVILAGHGVVKAAAKMGLERVPVIQLDIDKDDPRALKVLAGDNEMGRLSDSDDRLLTELLKEISAADGLMGTGFDDHALAALLMVTRPTSEVEDFDAAAEWTGMPDFNPGDKSFRLVVQFRDEADRQRFVAEYGLKVTDKKHGGKAGGQTWSTWWPEREPDDRVAVEWREAEQPDGAGG